MPREPFIIPTAKIIGAKSNKRFKVHSANEMSPYHGYVIGASIPIWLYHSLAIGFNDRVFSFQTCILNAILSNPFLSFHLPFFPALIQLPKIKQKKAISPLIPKRWAVSKNLLQ